MIEPTSFRALAHTLVNLVILQHTASASQPCNDRPASGGEVIGWERPMNKSDFVLAAMAPAGAASFSRVQMQKALFLLDRNIPDLTGGPHFNFKPHFYGPFDPDVYRALEALARRGCLTISPGQPSPTYSLTPPGLDRGLSELAKLEQGAQGYVREVVNFVRTVSFQQLVSSIYHAYPEMAESSLMPGRQRVPHPVE